MTDDAFPAVLSRAITQRDVTLESLARELRILGTPVSMATLSYWRAGRSAPARAGSLRALANLERLLEVPPGHLTGALAHVGKDVQWGAGLSEDGLQQALAGMGMDVDGGLVKLVLHDTLFPDEHPDRHRRLTRQLIRAVRDDVVRLPVVTLTDPDGQGTPVVEAVSGCRIGTTTVLEEHRSTVVEVLLDRPLRRGDETQVCYQITWPHTRPPTSFERQLRLPVHYLCLEARFRHRAPDDVRYELSSLDADQAEPTARLPRPAGRTPQYVGRNAAPGVHRLAWGFAGTPGPTPPAHGPTAPGPEHPGVA